MMMTRSILFCSLVLLFSSLSPNNVNAYLSGLLEDGGVIEEELENSRSFDRLKEKNDFAPQEETILREFKEFFGVRSQREDLAHREVPQFMIELYNTIAGPSGVTRSRNPHNAKIVRSFIEKETSAPHLYFFNISGLEINETVLEAELHLYRKETPLKNIHLSSYYIIKIYQVLEGRNLDKPYLHRLLNVRYIGAHASGWQVFSIKQAVLKWMNEEPNLGLLVTTSILLNENEVRVEFFHRHDYRHGKQPILVLFDDNSGDITIRSENFESLYDTFANRNHRDEEKKEEENEEQKETDKELPYEKDTMDEIIEKDKYDSVDRNRLHIKQYGQPEQVLLENRRESEFFERQKRIREEREEENESEGDNIFNSEDDQRESEMLALRITRRRRDAVLPSKRFVKITSRDTKTLTSMDIYARAKLRRKLGQTVRDRLMRQSIPRHRRSARLPMSDRREATLERNNTRECTKHELYVDFENIELFSSIISPLGYSAYQCKGVCEQPLSQDQQPTNHATIQAIVHKMGLVENVERPCCVPTKLSNISILFFKDESVVLKLYEDMVADHCGCR